MRGSRSNYSLSNLTTFWELSDSMYNILQAEEIIYEILNYKYLNLDNIRKFSYNKYNQNIKKIIDQKYPSFLINMGEIFYILKTNIEEIIKEKFCYCGSIKHSFDGEKYSKYCSLKCAAANETTKNKRKETCIIKYGSDTPAGNKEIIEKIKTTKNEKYGSMSFNNREKAKKTCVDKYGVENPNQSNNVKQRKKHTFIERYGIEHNSQLASVKDSKRLNSIEKYQANSPLENKDIQNKIKQINMSRLGCEYPMQSESVKEKRRLNNIIKYGVDNQNQIHLTNLNNLNENYIRNNFIKNGLFLIDEFCEYYNYSKSHSHKIRQMFNIEELAPANFCQTQFKLADWIQSLNISIINNERKILYGKELDLYIPSHKLAIEYDGLMFHSFGKSEHSMFNNHTLDNKNNHLFKTEECEKRGIQLLHIFENEWLTKQDIWKSVIKAKLGLNKRIFARTCQLKEIDYKTSSEFLENNHLQGSCVSSIQIGLFFDNNLVSIMTFGKSRYNKKYQYELLRFCNKIDINVVGGASKLLKHFVKKYNPLSIVSYANRRWSDGNLYRQIGFDEVDQTEPNYFYFKPSEYILHSRIKFQKHKLQEQLESFDNSLTETENMYNNDYRKIYDCGNLVFVKTF